MAALEDGDMEYTKDDGNVAGIAAGNMRSKLMEIQQDMAPPIGPEEAEKVSHEIEGALAAEHDEAMKGQTSEGPTDGEEAANATVDTAMSVVEEAHKVGATPSLAAAVIAVNDASEKGPAAEPDIVKICEIQVAMNAVSAMYKPSINPMQTMLRAHEMMEIYVHSQSKDGKTFSVKAALKGNLAMMKSINNDKRIMREWRQTLAKEEEPTTIGNGKPFYKRIDDGNCPLSNEERKGLGKKMHAEKQTHNFLCGLDHLLHAKGQVIKNKDGVAVKVSFGPGWCKNRLNLMIKVQANHKQGLNPVAAQKSRKRKGKGKGKGGNAAGDGSTPPTAPEPETMTSLFHSRYLLAAIARQENASARQPRSRSVGRRTSAARPSQTRTDARPGWMNNLGM